MTTGGPQDNAAQARARIPGHVRTRLLIGTHTRHDRALQILIIIDANRRDDLALVVGRRLRHENMLATWPPSHERLPGHMLSTDRTEFA